MQRSRTNFAVLPPSIYPTPDAENTPAFETTYAEGYCERLNDDVFRKSTALPSSSAGGRFSNTAAAAYGGADGSHRFSVTSSAIPGVTGAAFSGGHSPSATLASRGFSGACTQAAYGPHGTLRSGLPCAGECGAHPPMLTTTNLSLSQRVASVGANGGVVAAAALEAGAGGFCGGSMQYSAQTQSADPRRGEHDALRDTQNARFKVYTRAYGRF